MYLTPETLEDMEQRRGRPRRERVEAAFAEHEFGLLEYCYRKGRAHDVTLMIRRAPGAREFALIRKPSYPPGLFRPPSGGVEEGEGFEAGACREALEETGLEVRLDHYLLRVDAQFTHAGRTCPWTTHVFSATAEGGVLEPRDRHEIEEARWATAEEMRTRYRPLMLELGSAGMAYRVFLQDTALELMDPAGNHREEGVR